MAVGALFAGCRRIFSHHEAIWGKIFPGRALTVRRSGMANSPSEIARSLLEFALSATDIANSTFDIAKSAFEISNSFSDIAMSVSQIAKSDSDIANSVSDIAKSNSDFAIWKAGNPCFSSKTGCF
jgi:hypothetical protein